MQVVLFAVPGAYTPTCSLKHLPGFIEKADAIKALGVDTIACVSVSASTHVETENSVVWGLLVLSLSLLMGCEG
jgi:peroxiredoxin